MAGGFSPKQLLLAQTMRLINSRLIWDAMVPVRRHWKEFWTRGSYISGLGAVHGFNFDRRIRNYSERVCHSSLLIVVKHT